MAVTPEEAVKPSQTVMNEADEIEIRWDLFIKDNYCEGRPIIVKLPMTTNRRTKTELQRRYVLAGWNWSELPPAAFLDQQDLVQRLEIHIQLAPAWD
jgi:hypothetical protein